MFVPVRALNAGSAGILLGYPFDTVKVMMQTQAPPSTMAHPSAAQYTGTIQCIRSIIARDSVAGLYRGLSSPLAGVALVNAVVFGVYGNVQRRAADPDALQTQMFAGMAAGLVQTVITSPMELTKTRMQMQCAASGAGGGMAQQYRGAIDCARHIRRTEGLRGLYRGFSITVARDVPGFASYFVLYDLLVRAGKSTTDNQPAGALHTLLAGGAAGVGSWILTMPIDVVKTRLQVDGPTGGGAQRPRYTGIVDCVNQSWRSEGWRFLTRGMSSTLLRAFLMNSVCFYVVAFVMHTCENNGAESSSAAVVVDAEPLLMAGGAVAAGAALPAHAGAGLLKESVQCQQQRSRNEMGGSGYDCASVMPLSKMVMYLSALSDAVYQEDIVEFEEECRRGDASKRVASYYDATHELLDSKVFLDDQLRIESK